MRFALLLLGAVLAGCASGPPPPDWKLAASASLRAFQQAYLRGETRLAELEFRRAVDELRATGRADLVARAELIRCAARAASLEFDECPGFEARRADAGKEEIAYAEYLAGRAERAASEEPFARLVAAGVRMRAGKLTPQEISAAVETASAQGWRRPLLAWLGVQEKRAEAAGDKEAVERIRRRIALVLGRD